MINDFAQSVLEVDPSYYGSLWVFPCTNGASKNFEAPLLRIDFF